MQQMLRDGITAVFLLGCSVCDVRTRRIPGLWLFCFWIVGLVVELVFPTPFSARAGGFLIGGLILLLGRLSGEQIGYGDGLMLLIGALYLRATEVVWMLIIALFLCALFAVVLFLENRTKRGCRLPFAPFLACGFLLCRTASWLEGCG